MPPPHHRHPPPGHSYKPLTPLRPRHSFLKGHNEKRSAHGKDTGKEKQVLVHVSAFLCLLSCGPVGCGLLEFVRREQRTLHPASTAFHRVRMCRLRVQGRHERQRQGENELRESHAPTPACGQATRTLALYVRYAPESTAGALLRFKVQSHPPRAARQVPP